MITRISGRLEAVDTDRVELDTGDGRVHEILVPAFLARALTTRVGEAITLHTRELLEGQAQGTSFVPRMLGFASREDRRFFELFTSAKGLGPRRALRAIAEPPADIARAIVTRDAKALTRLPEIGRKLAETLILELADKVAEFTSASPVPAFAPGAVQATSRGTGLALPAHAATAADALVALGEPREHAERLVARALAQDPALDSADAVIAAALGAR